MFPFTAQIEYNNGQMQSHKAQTENRNITNLRTTPTPDAKPRTSNCFNHPDKPATHSLLPPTAPHPLLYCEKCSIMLASKGHNIIKLNSSARPTPLRSPMRSPRQREIEQFLGDLAQQVGEMERLQEESEEVLRGSEMHFAGVLEQVTAFFQEIEDVLEVQKYLSYNAILNHRAALEADLRLARQTLQNQVQELVSIGNDIQNNMEAVQQVQDEIYESIMHNYRHKAALAEELQQMQLPPVLQPIILLPEIPKMLYSLADKLTLRQDSPRETYTLPPQPTKQPLSNRNQSYQGSYRQQAHQTDTHPPKKSLSSFLNLKNAESIDSKQREIAFSFEENNDGEYCLQKALFGRREGFHPQEMVFRESLSLTEIKENEDEVEPNYRRYGVLEETIPIPQEMMTSQESIGGYFANTLNYSPRELNERGEDTETLLIC